MNSRTLRRLASDHADLHKAGLPPNYLFPQSAAHSVPDDLTKLDVLLAGAHGTPYSEGVWKLHLSIPQDYPKTPPKASFRTQMWHPNVDVTTGAICVETLKRDWDPQLTLRHILVTISCLLIYPNPDSALNAEASALQQDDYEMFARRAKTMTAVQAPIPKHLAQAVAEAQRRGEDRDTKPAAVASSAECLKSQSTTRDDNAGSCRTGRKPAMSEPEDISRSSDAIGHTYQVDEDESDSSKENEPSTTIAALAPPLPSSTKGSILGKRPLADLSDHFTVDTESGQGSCFNSQAMKVTPNATQNTATPEQDQDIGAPPRKSPKTDKSAQAHVVRDKTNGPALVRTLNADSAGDKMKLQYKNGKPVIVNAPLGGVADAKMTQMPKNSVWPRRGIYRL